MCDCDQAKPRWLSVENLAAIAGGAVVFTVVGFGTRRLLRRMFDDEPDAAIVVLPRPPGHLDAEGEPS